MAKIMVIDLETQNNPYYGAIASPRHPENYVVMVGQAIDENPFDGAVTGQRFNSKAEAGNWLQIPDDVWLVVAHNASYELDWMIHEQYTELMKFLKRGGRIFCTQIGHYLLSNQQEKYPTLDAIAPSYGGSHKVDGIKILWDQGVRTADIDPALLSEYLLGPEGDIENTRKVFYGQYQQLVQRGMWDMALARMEGMLFNAFAMASGLYVNRDIAFKQLEEQTTELNTLVAKFQTYRTDMPAELEFKETSDYHMSAWIYGGPIKYRAKVPWLNDDGTPKYEKVDCYEYEGGGYIEVDKYNSAEGMFTVQPLVLFKSGKNKGQPKVFKIDSPEPKMKWGELIYKAPGLLSIDALPRDLAKAFKEEFTGKRKLSDDSPVYGTGKDALEKLAVRPEISEEVRGILNDLLKFAKLDKDIGTYYLREEKDDDGNVVKQSGMLQFLTPPGIVHHSLNMTSTETGRLSSNRPNFQNIPRGDTSEVKKVFTSRFGDDGYIIEADYSALEVVCLAAFSKDENLIKALMEGIDMHCMRLSKKLNESYESVYEKCHNQEHPEHKRYKTMRTDIKPPSFAYQYGATAMGISFATGMPVEEAEQFIANEKALFPGVENFFDNIITPVVEKSATLHREQMDSGAWRMYKIGTWVSPAGTTYSFRQYPKRIWADGESMDVMQFKPTQIRNYPIQGESSFFVQAACGWVLRWFVQKNFFDGKACIINTVHDAIYLDIHKSVLPEVAKNLKFLMEYIPEGMKAYGYDLNVPFPVEVSYGPSMFEQHKFKAE